MDSRKLLEEPSTGLDSTVSADMIASHGDSGGRVQDSSNSSILFWKPSLDICLVTGFPKAIQTGQMPMQIHKRLVFLGDVINTSAATQSGIPLRNPIEEHEKANFFPAVYHNDFWVTTKV